MMVAAFFHLMHGGGGGGALQYVDWQRCDIIVGSS